MIKKKHESINSVRFCSFEQENGPNQVDKLKLRYET